MIQQPNQNLFTGIFAEDGNHIGGYAEVWHQMSLRSYRT